MHFFWIYIKKIILDGAVETNPEPQSKTLSRILNLLLEIKQYCNTLGFY